MFSRCEFVVNNSSPTLAKNNPKLEYINEEQPSSLELAFGVELGLSHYWATSLNVN